MLHDGPRFHSKKIFQAPKTLSELPAAQLLMFQFINHYSFLIFTLPLLVGALFVLLRGKGSRWKQILSVLLVLLVAAVYFLFQPGERSLVAADAVVVLSDPGRPILLEFYSDY